MKILGISAYYHDSAAVIVENGKIIAAAQEERFTRKKHDPSFPAGAVKFCLNEAGIQIDELDAVAFYDKPWLKFERLMMTYYITAPKGVKSFINAAPVWMKEKLFLKKVLLDELEAVEPFSKGSPRLLLFPEHHLSHAASAYYPSPFNEAAILTIDGVGEWATASICYGAGKDITVKKELTFPHSVGLLYSAFTYYLGFRVNSGEYKLMGLAPYGNKNARMRAFKDKITGELIDIKPDGSIWLNQKYFDYLTGDKMTDNKKFERLFGVKKREPNEPLEQTHCDMALAIQEITEDIVLKMAAHAKEITLSKNLCLAGGVALNCVSNAKILESKMFDNVWVQPASGDAGGALGAALAAHHIYFGNEKEQRVGDNLNGAYLGPSYCACEIGSMIKAQKAVACELLDDELFNTVAEYIANGKVVGWFSGRAEYGPRALGNRSILGDGRSATMQERMNVKIKYRESFRPFAPSVLEEKAADYFDVSTPLPYMLITAQVKKELRNPLPDGYENFSVKDKLYYKRSTLPAITHIDYSARVQTVSKNTNPRYHALIEAFEKLTGCAVIINTSFNVRGEPIVNTPLDAYRCFMRTDMDILVIENFVFIKEQQPKFNDKKEWRQEFTLD